MKIKTILTTVAFIFSVAAVSAQTNIPAEYVKGSIKFADGSTASGFIKDNLKKSAAVSFFNANGADKQNYDASQINGVTIDVTEYVCVKGDFFKRLSGGKLNFLQKASHAAGKVFMNGTQPVYLSGTEGKIGDYFVYTDNDLKLMNKKTVEAFISTQLTGCNEAIEKAKSINGDMAKLQQAVDIYNKTN